MNNPRYKVKFKWVKWKGNFYKAGELLPPEFSWRDKEHNVNGSRIQIATPEEVAKLEEVGELEDIVEEPIVSEPTPLNEVKLPPKPISIKLD